MRAHHGVRHVCRVGLVRFPGEEQQERTDLLNRLVLALARFRTIRNKQARDQPGHSYLFFLQDICCFEVRVRLCLRSHLFFFPLFWADVSTARTQEVLQYATVIRDLHDSVERFDRLLQAQSFLMSPLPGMGGLFFSLHHCGKGCNQTIRQMRGYGFLLSLIGFA